MCARVTGSRVKRRRSHLRLRVSAEENGYGEDEEARRADGNEDAKEENSGKKTSKKSKMRKRRPVNELKDNRSLKRRRFEQDMSFLDPTVAELQPELNLPASVSFCCASHDCSV